MKRVVLNYLAIAAIVVLAAFTSCGGGSGSSGGRGGGGKWKIKMNTESSRGEFYLAGSGTATVDWGDGTEKVTLTLNDNRVRFEHDYPNATIRNITINGENIKKIFCAGNGLTSLDVSKATELTYLWCPSNQLSSLDVSKCTALKELLGASGRHRDGKSTINQNVEASDLTEI